MSVDDDFVYDQSETLALKVAHNNVVQAESKAFWYGVISSVLFSSLLRRQTNNLPFVRNALGVFFGAQVYGFQLGPSKEQYSILAARLNANASLSINKSMKY